MCTIEAVQAYGSNCFLSRIFSLNMVITSEGVNKVNVNETL
jgi:hypothetical protein